MNRSENRQVFRVGSMCKSTSLTNALTYCVDPSREGHYYRCQRGASSLLAEPPEEEPTTFLASAARLARLPAWW